MDANGVGRGFIKSPWRYSQFVVVGLIVAALVRWLGDASWWISLAAGAIAGIGLWWLEKKRGVI